jgi:hypothetical protein
MAYKEGDEITVQTQQWIDAHEKDDGGNIWPKGGGIMVRSMFRYAGRTAEIARVDAGDAPLDARYRLDIDDGEWAWSSGMFVQDRWPLSAKNAVLAMLAGDTLYDVNDWPHRLNESTENFEFVDGTGTVHDFGHFEGLRGLFRSPPDRTLLMSTSEALAWATSEESAGWAVRAYSVSSWGIPASFTYSEPYNLLCQRAKLSPDGVSVDESTIRWFDREE